MHISIICFNNKVLFSFFFGFEGMDSRSVRLASELSKNGCKLFEVDVLDVIAFKKGQAGNIQIYEGALPNLTALLLSHVNTGNIEGMMKSSKGEFMEVGYVVSDVTNYETLSSGITIVTH